MSCLYCHLIPQTTQLVSQSLKVILQNENALINDLRLQILAILDKQNDGNKEYKVTGIKAHEEGQVLPLSRRVDSHFQNNEDVFVNIEVVVDKSKHVKPIQQITTAKPQQASKTISGLASADKFVSLAKYSFYESGKSWVKVILDLKDIKSHSADKIVVEFKPRTFFVKVLEFKGQNYQFTVPKTQCYVLPDKCKYEVKNDSIVISLRKAKDDDNWWSLYRSKAVGEVDSD